MITRLILFWGIVNTTCIFAQSLPRAGIKKIHINDSIIHPPFNNITLQPEQDDLTIYFVDTPSVDTYIYQLEGLDKNTLTTQYPITRYTNLTGKEYVFTLTTQRNTDTSEPVQLSIKVLPKTVESPWFIPALVLYVSLLVSAIAYFWMMYNFRQKMRLQKIRNQIAGDLHDEVGSTLSSIAVFSKALKRNFAHKDQEMVSTLDNIIQSAEHTNINLHDTVWSLNPDKDKAEDLFEKIRSHALQTLMAQDIELVFDADTTALKDTNISMIQRRNVHLMLREAINNIIKHSEATKVCIAIRKEGRKIRLTIQDNGKGFDQLRGESGNGLKNFQHRAKESFIKFNIETKPNEGTTITMLIPQL